MARRGASRRRRSRARAGRPIHPLVGGLLIAFSILLLIGGLVAIWPKEGPQAMLGALFSLWNPTEHNKETLCPKTGPEAGIVILLDLTDRIGATQQARLRDLLEKKIADARQNTLIAVGAVGSAPAERGVDFALCKPMEESAANKLYQNPRLVAESYEKRFQRPLKASLEKMLIFRSAERSPIMESLQAALASTPGFLDAAYSRRVLIVSDLLQHSAAFSFYRGDTWRKFQRSRNFARLARSLHGVDVEILRLPRPEAKIDSAEVEDFWANYFDQAGARRVRSRMLGDL